MNENLKNKNKQIKLSAPKKKLFKNVKMAAANPASPQRFPCRMAAGKGQGGEVLPFTQE